MLATSGTANARATAPKKQTPVGLAGRPLALTATLAAVARGSPLRRPRDPRHLPAADRRRRRRPRPRDPRHRDPSRSAGRARSERAEREGRGSSRRGAFGRQQTAAQSPPPPGRPERLASAGPPPTSTLEASGRGAEQRRHPRRRREGPDHRPRPRRPRRGRRRRCSPLGHRGLPQRREARGGSAAGLGGPCTNGTSVPSGVSPDIAKVHEAVCAAFPTSPPTARSAATASTPRAGPSTSWSAAPAARRSRDFVRANYAALGVNTSSTPSRSGPWTAAARAGAACPTAARPPRTTTTTSTSRSTDRGRASVVRARR